MITTFSNKVFSFTMDSNELNSRMNQVILDMVEDIHNVYESIFEILENELFSPSEKAEALDAMFSEAWLDRHKFTEEVQGSAIMGLNGNYHFHIKDEVFDLPLE